MVDRWVFRWLTVVNRCYFVHKLSNTLMPNQIPSQLLLILPASPPLPDFNVVPTTIADMFSCIGGDSTLTTGWRGGAGGKTYYATTTLTVNMCEELYIPT